MKKILTGGLLAVAAASMLFAATDKINLYDAEGYLNRSIAVEDIENMSYTSSTRSEGFSHMNLNFRNGASELLELSANELMEYQASRGDCRSSPSPVRSLRCSIAFRACPNGSWSPLAWTKAYGRNP